MKSLVFLIVLGMTAQFSLAYDGQPKKLTFLAHPGKTVTATLQDIDLRKLKHTPATEDDFEYFHPKEGDEPITLMVDKIEYQLTELRRENAETRFAIFFESTELGTKLVLLDVKPRALIEFQGSRIKAKRD